MIVLYDRDCGFCAWMLAWLLRWDRRRRLRPAEIQGPIGDAYLADIPPDQRLTSWHAVDADGVVASGGPAIPRVLALLPGATIPRRLLVRFPGATARAYAWIAAHRAQLARPLTAGAKARARALVAERAATWPPG